MNTITRGIKELISEVEADMTNWQSIHGTEQWDSYYGEHEAVEERKVWGYNERIKTTTAMSEIERLLDLLNAAYDLADSLEDKRIIQK